MLGSKEADSRAVARQGRGLTRAGSGNTSHIPAWTVRPALLDPHTVEAESESLKVILSSEHSLGAHQPGWMRAPCWGEQREGAEKGCLNREGLGLQLPSVPRQQLRKVSKGQGASAWLEAGFLKCLTIE